MRMRGDERGDVVGVKPRRGDTRKDIIQSRSYSNKNKGFGRRLRKCDFVSRLVSSAKLLFSELKK